MTVMNELPADYEQLVSRVLPAIRDDLSEAEFDARMLEVFAFQQRWNVPYARYCATRPLPMHWSQIPAVPQSIFKRFRLSVAPADATPVTFLTSGTTGETRGAHHFLDTRLYDAAIAHGWARLKRPDLAKIILTPPSVHAPHSSLAHMMGQLADETTIFALAADGQLEVGRILAGLEVLHSLQKPVALLGTALAFLNLFEQMGSARPKLCPGSFAMETGGYKGSGRDIPKAELYGRFTEALGLATDDVISEYGMTELSSQCYSRGLNRVHEAPPWMRALVFDPETGEEVDEGEIGVLRLYDLANVGSVVSLETQDLAVRRADGFELIGRDPAALPRGCSRAADEAIQASLA